MSDIELDVGRVERHIRERDREMDNDFTKDAQITAMRGARSYRGDKLIRVATPHKLLDPKAGPLIAVKLHVVTRKSLGGIETDLSGRALGADGQPIPGLYAAGEASGFGGGGVHGYRSLEGTFLGGCLFSGRQAGTGDRARLNPQGRQARRVHAWRRIRIWPRRVVRRVHGPVSWMVTGFALSQEPEALGRERCTGGNVLETLDRPSPHFGTHPLDELLARTRRNRLRDLCDAGLRCRLEEVCTRLADRSPAAAGR